MTNSLPVVPSFKKNTLAGLRLIEKKNSFPPDNGASGGKPGRPSSPFWSWCEANTIPETTARTLMTFAGFSEEQREEHKAKERDRKRQERAKVKPEFKLVWNMVLIQALGPNVTRAIKRGYKTEVEQLMGEEIPSHFTSEEEADAFVERYIEKVGVPKDAPREQLPKSAEEKLQRAVRIETAKLHASYREEVEKGIKAELADRIAHLEQLREKAAAREKRYDLLIAGIKPVITKDDYRFLLNVFHSDRTPTKDKLDKAFVIVKKLEPYID